MTTGRLITFTAGQASRATGVSPVMQRDWRRRHFIRAVEGRAEFNAFDLADLMIMKMMSDFGVGPASSREWKHLVASCVVSRALMSPEAYDGIMPADSNVRDHIRRSLLWNVVNKAGFYTGELSPEQIFKRVLRAPRFAVLWSEDVGSLGKSLDDLHERQFKSERPTTPAIFIDVHGAATDLLREAGPLVLCEN